MKPLPYILIITQGYQLFNLILPNLILVFSLEISINYYLIVDQSQ